MTANSLKKKKSPSESKEIVEIWTDGAFDPKSNIGGWGWLSYCASCQINLI